MADTPEQAQPAPPQAAPAAPGLPPAVANIWNKFASRELAKGRRDIGHLVEVTLQFVMDQNTKNLAPMVNTLEQLRKWLLAIDKELGNMQKALSENRKPVMDAAYQRQSIVLDKNGKNGPAVVISPSGQPTRTRSDLQSYVVTMQKQRELVNQAISEQTNALQARRDHLAQTLRQYSAELQRSAAEMLANAPPLPEPAPKKKRKKGPSEGGLGGDESLPQVRPRRARPSPAEWLGRFVRWLTGFNPVTMVRDWGRALVSGYRADPFELPQVMDMHEPVVELDANGKKKPKVFTI